MTKILVNGIELKPADPGHWAVDQLRGVHQIAIGKDLVEDNRWGVGQNVIPGPPGPTDFSLEAWVEGDGEVHLLEARVRDLLSRFRPTGYGKNSIMTVENWEGAVHAPFRIRTADADMDYANRAARVKIVCENIWGVWKSTQMSVVQGDFTGAQVTVNSGHATIHDMEILIYGPVTNPKIESQNRWFQYNGTIADGSFVRVRTQPISAILNNSASVLGKCDWWGSGGRGLDIAPGDKMWASGTGTGVNSRWIANYYNIIY